jgi:adenosylcobinamide-GDP ribazoletransferase
VLAAFGYFSIVPVRHTAAPPGSAALAALPLVGAAVGALAGVAAYGVSLACPAPFGAVAAFAGLAVLTGAIHLDGFLDGCDAFIASVPAERRLAILKDPRHGTFAVVGFVLVAAFALAALAAIPAARYPLVLAFASAASRAAAVTGAFVFPAARGAAGTPHFARSRGVLAALAATFVVLAAWGFAAFGPAAAAAVPLSVALALAVEAWIAARLGGLAGDAYGFTIVVVETAFLVAFAVRFSHP